MPHRIFWWHVIKFKKRERKSVLSRWNHVYTDTNSCWVIKLNATWSLWNRAMKLCIVEVVLNIILFLSCLCGYLGNINMKHSIGISLKLIWHSYLVSSLGNCTHKTPIETGLRVDRNYDKITTATPLGHYSPPSAPIAGPLSPSLSQRLGGEGMHGQGAEVGPVITKRNSYNKGLKQLPTR